MKIHKILVRPYVSRLGAIVSCTVLFGAALNASGEVPFIDHAITVGLRLHADHPDYEQIPMVADDISYLAAYEYHEGAVYWQLGFSYCPEANSTSYVGKVESVVTPQINLAYESDSFWAAVGLLKSRVQGEPSLWTGFYWQVALGVQLPISQRIEARVGAFYIFDNWSGLKDFDTDEIELGASLSWSY